MIEIGTLYADRGKARASLFVKVCLSSQWIRGFQMIIYGVLLGPDSPLQPFVDLALFCNTRQF